MFDFPNSPTEGQIYAPPGGPRYQWNSPVWDVVGASGAGSSDDLWWETRAAFVASVAGGMPVYAGKTYTAGGLQYAGSPGAAVIADLPGLLPFGGIASYVHFGADLTGVAPADAKMIACHAWANATPGVKVVQNSGTVLWRGGASCIVKTDFDLKGLTIRLDALSNAYDPPVFFIQRNAAKVSMTAPELADLQASYGHQLKKGSYHCDHPFFATNKFCHIDIRTSNVDAMRGDGGSTYHLIDYIVTSKEGDFAVGLVKNVDTNLTSVDAYPREKTRLTGIGPTFSLEGAKNFMGFQVERNQVTLRDIVLKDPAPEPVALFSRCLISAYYCWDLEIDDVHTEAQSDDFGGGVYGLLGFQRCTGIVLRNCHSYGGWGSIASFYAKDVLLDQCTINRLDSHWSGYDFHARDTTFVNIGIRFHGGGICKATNCKWVLTEKGPDSADGVTGFSFWYGRIDGAYEFSGNLIIEGLDIIVGTAITYAKADYITIARIGDPVSWDYLRDMYSAQTVDIRNVKIYTSPLVQGLTSAEPFMVIGAQVLHTYTGAVVGRKVFAPKSITVDNMQFMDTAPTQFLYATAVSISNYGHASVYAYDVADTVARYGTNSQVVISNVHSRVPENILGVESASALRMINSYSALSPHYLADADAYLPRVIIRDCPRLFVDMAARGALSISDSKVLGLDTERPTPLDLLVRISNCTIAPTDRATTSGSATYQMTVGLPGNVLYTGNQFLTPLDGTTLTYTTAVNLTGVKGSGNALVGGALAAHYTGVPAGFFVV